MTFISIILKSTQRRHQRSEFREAQRRAQSEGPGIRNPMFRISNDGPELRPSLPSSRPVRVDVFTHGSGAWARSRFHSRCTSSCRRRIARTPRDTGRRPPRQGGTACWSRPGCHCSGRRGNHIRKLKVSEKNTKCEKTSPIAI